jgi:two-component system, OmpR family, response regulator
MQNGKILLVDDDMDLRDLVTTYLRREGFATDEAATGAAALKRFADADIDLVLLDVRLPDADGFDLLRNLRDRGRTPVIMLTGTDTPLDRVVGLELGADDYIGKPFELRELKARIRSVLRRTHQLGDADPQATVEILTFLSFTLDLTHRRLLDGAAAEVDLTGGEFDLLRALAEHPRRPLARDQLLDLTRARDWTPFDRSIDVLIGRLRRKLDARSGETEVIKTVRNVGYMLAAEVKRRRVAPAVLQATGGQGQTTAA